MNSEIDVKWAVGSFAIGIGIGLLIILCIWGLVRLSYTTYRLTYVQNGKEITRIVQGYPCSIPNGRIIVRQNQITNPTFECSDCYIKQIEEIEE